MTVSFRPGLTAGSLFFMISAAFVTSWAGQPRSAAASPPEMDWPAVSKQCRPWTYWWWLGSAVSRSELTRHLTAYHQAGMGGVHIVPIYGAEGYQDRYINYLTPKWMEMLAHTVTEANRLGMGVDMTSGTGWPFGGPWVGPEHAAARVFFQTYDLGPGQRLDQPIRSKKQPAAALQALMAFGGTDEPVELTDKVDPDGRLDWSPPAGSWKLYAAFQGWTTQQVKRAAPGAEGNVLNYFSRRALDHYLARFDEAFADYQVDLPRGFYNDSFEVYGANWTDNLLAEFEKRRGYDLRRQLPALLGEDSLEGEGPVDRAARVRSDYRETVADLLLEEFTLPWVAWAHEKGAITRSQAHGSPGNILDLYAAVDIPETEGWQQPGANILVSKIASSAAHLYQKPYASSESCTWLKEHFQVALGDVKGAIDRLLLSGINHVFYHGMPFSPADAAYPGWLFYAATHFGLTNSFYRDLPCLNDYIARCQSFLQAGGPDEDVLLYIPIYDLWAAQHGAARNRLQYMSMHNIPNWFAKNLEPTHRTARTMWDRGYTFDYVSDRVITERLAADKGAVRSGKQSYRAIVIAGCKLIPVKTLGKLMALARQGATIIVVGALPSDVPGLGDLAKRREQHERLRAEIVFEPTAATGVKQGRMGAGRFLLGDDLEALLACAGVTREPLVDSDLEFIRRANPKGHHYFVVNLSETPFDGWMPLRARAESVVLFDPRSGRRGLTQVRNRSEAGSEVRLQLPAGESCVLKTLAEPVEGDAWTYLSQAGPAHTITGTWQVTFIEGGEKLPAAFTTDQLASWTELGGRDARAFTGTARYEISFDKPAARADEWLLDLGQVRESARIKLNGQPLPTLWCRPFRMPAGHALREGKNTLTVEVTNLMANRIADMDRRKVPWRTYFFVGIDYRPFDASAWEPMPSGLLGPVKLIPCTAARGHAGQNN